MKRNIGDIYKYGNRNMIKTDSGVQLYAHFVAKAFPEICGEWFDGCEVHHIDGNSLNDNPYNLIVLSSETHHKLHTKTVVAFYKNNYLGKFDSVTDCANYLGISPAVISYFCKHNKPISSSYINYRFAYPV